MKEDIKALRNEIDYLDKEIIRAIQKRFLIVSKISEFKKQNQLEIVDDQRTKEVLQNNCRFAESMGVDPDLIEKVFNQIIHHSILYQKGTRVCH